MIHQARDDLVEIGFNQVEQVTDSYGTIGYVVEFMGQRYVLVAKDYAYNNLASFMARLVNHSPEDWDLIFYCEDDASFTVFDGDYYRANADESHGESKKRDCVWLELSRECGAELDAFIRGEDDAWTLSGANATLGDF